MTWIVSLLAVLIPVMGMGAAIFYAKRLGATEERLDNATDITEAAAKRKKTEHDVRVMPDSELDRVLQEDARE